MTTDAPLAHSGDELTLEQWAALGEDEPGELVDGRLLEEEAVGVLHEAVVSWLLRVVGMWIGMHGGRVFGSELKLAVAKARGRKPDVVIYFPGAALPKRRDNIVRQPPTIVVEVLSPDPRDARRDRVDKLAEYARFGIRYYWIVDPVQRVLEVLELGADGRYLVALSAASGAQPVPGCSGLVLDLDALWSDIDAIPDDED